MRIAHGSYDQQWLIPDHRLINAARSELWRVAEAHQVHLLEPAREAPPRAGQRGSRAAPPGPPPAEVELSFAALLPDGHSPAGRPGRIRPLYRRPGGREPNLAPGLRAHLTRRLRHEVAADDLFAWIAAVAQRGPEGAPAVPLTASPELWEAGVALGRRRVWLPPAAPAAAPQQGPRAGPGCRAVSVRTCGPRSRADSPLTRWVTTPRSTRSAWETAGSHRWPTPRGSTAAVGCGCWRAGPSGAPRPARPALWTPSGRVTGPRNGRRTCWS